MVPRKICIVTPDAVGPVTNGGIGTHVWWLAQSLASKPSEFAVSVLFTGPYERGSRESVGALYRDLGIEFFDLDDTPAPTVPEHGREWFVEHSIRVRRFLETRAFDVIHFQDWRANGYQSIRAKRMGLAFRDTLLTVTLHSPSEWIREGMEEWPTSPVSDALLDSFERYAVAHADVVISPSHAMVAWCRSKGWTFGREPEIAPNCYGGPPRSPSGAADVCHIAFFGRLETRKGIELFLRAAEQVAADEGHGLRRVSLIGKGGRVRGGEVEALVHESASRLSAKGVSLSWERRLSSEEALVYLERERPVTFVCSLLDNYPYAVVECVARGLSILASRVGGIPEILPEERLFSPTVSGIAEAIRQRERRVAASSAGYDREAAAGRWFEISSWSVSLEQPHGTPRVSVCIAHFNYGAYLPILLDSLAQSAYPSLEVVVIDDGSRDEHSLSVFREQHAQYASRGWKFVEQENQGIGAARNAAARLASGDLIIFMDADNVAMPTMVERFVHAAETSGADCLTCHFMAFEGEGSPVAPVYGYIAHGMPLGVGMLANVFGDANFCIRRSVFEAIGGFTLDRGVSFEDWELLATCVLRGFELDVVPEALFWYRHLPGGLSRMTSSYANESRVVRAYVRYASREDLVEMQTRLTLPLFRQVREYVALADHLTEEKRLLRHELRRYDRLVYRLAGKIVSLIDRMKGVGRG